MAFLIFYTIDIVLNVISIPTSTSELHNDYKTASIVMSILVSIALLALGIYIWLCTYAFYREVKHEYEMKTAKENPSNRLKNDLKVKKNPSNMAETEV